jgi:hypothetical protein
VKRILILLLLFGTCAGCVTLTPREQAVRLTRDERDVEGCKELEPVNAMLSWSFGESTRKLKRAAARVGGDTVLVNSEFGNDHGTAYDCSHRDEKKDAGSK